MIKPTHIHNSFRPNDMRKFNRFYDFSIRSATTHLSVVGERCWFAHFKVDGDFSPLFPFIQSTASGVVYYEFPEHIQFQLDNILCSLYPPDIVVSRLFYGREHAIAFAQQLIEYLNEIELKRTEINPDFKTFNRLHVPDILHFLPMNNCGECGFRSCMAFAGAISRRKTNFGMCPYFPEPVDAKVYFCVHDKDQKNIRRIEVDSQLAGISISKSKDAARTAQSPLTLKKRGKRLPGLKGHRDGIIFKLSGREAEVLRLITEGFTNKEMAQILNISNNTVKSHVLHIFNKLGVNDRTQAAVWAVQNLLNE